MLMLLTYSINTFAGRLKIYEAPFLICRWPLSYLKPNTLTSLYLAPATDDECQQIVNLLKSV